MPEGFSTTTTCGSRCKIALRGSAGVRVARGAFWRSSTSAPAATGLAGSSSATPSTKIFPVRARRRTSFQLLPGISSRNQRSSGFSPLPGKRCLVTDSRRVDARRVPARLDVNLQHIAVQAELRAVIHFVVAREAAYVKIALRIARNQLEPQRACALRRLRIAADFVDQEIRGLGRRRVARRNDRRVAHEHQLLARRRGLRKVGEGLNL